MEIPPEIKENLYPGERVVHVIEKKLKAELKPKFLVITDRRVIYLDQKILGRYELVDLPFEKIEQVYFRRGVVGAEFVIRSEEKNVIKLNGLEKEQAMKAINTIRDALNAISVEPVSLKRKKGVLGEEWVLHKPREVVTRTLPMTKVVEPERPREAARDDPVEKLKKLKELYDAGVISKEEFESRKQKLLEQL